MKSLLVLGGSHFVGRHIATAAVEAGWRVTVLNNETGPSRVPPGAAHIFADRLDAGEMSLALQGRHWDAVIDTWQDAPIAPQLSAGLLRETDTLYCLISSVTVYAECTRPPITEFSECRSLGPAPPHAYSARKRAAEGVVLSAFPDRSLILRPGLIVGPWEYAGRLPWWLLRMQHGGRVLAPGPRGRRLQWVDSRDLAAFALRCLSARVCDVVNVAGPANDLTMEHMLEMCRQATGADADIRWIDGGLLQRSGLAPWVDLPMWIPPTEAHATAYDILAEKADQFGMRYRPPTETVDDVWQWMTQLGPKGLAHYLDGREWLDRAREGLLLRSLDNDPGA